MTWMPPEALLDMWRAGYWVLQPVPVGRVGDLDLGGLLSLRGLTEREEDESLDFGRCACPFLSRMTDLSCPSLAPACSCLRDASLCSLPSWCWSEPWTSLFWELGPYSVASGGVGRLKHVKLFAGLPLESAPRALGHIKVSTSDPCG